MGGYSLGFAGLLQLFTNIDGWVIGGQGWIRTSVRKTGQIYSLLPLTTRPPVHTVQVLATLPKAGPAREAAYWRNGACLSMVEMDKSNYVIT